MKKQKIWTMNLNIKYVKLKKWNLLLHLNINDK